MMIFVHRRDAEFAEIFFLGLIFCAEKSDQTICLPQFIFWNKVTFGLETVPSE